MIIQTSTFTRTDASVPWFNDAPSMQEYIAPRDALRIARPDLASTPVVTNSEDGLTYTAVQTFPSLDSYNEYVYLLKQAIPRWPEGRDQYFKDHNQTIAVSVVDTYEG